jgi:hypothetical protein
MVKERILVTLNVKPQTRKVINAYVERFDFIGADQFINYLLQLAQVHFVINKGGIEELVELAYLIPKLKDGWNIKGIKTEEFTQI